MPVKQGGRKGFSNVIDFIEELDGPVQTPEDIAQIQKMTNGHGDPKQISKEKKRWDKVKRSQKDKLDVVLDTDVPLIERIMAHLERRMLFAWDFIILPCSIGGHMADIQQAPPVTDETIGVKGGKDLPFYMYRGQPEVMNIPVAIVMPPGFSKSFSMAQFFERRRGLCPLPSKFSGTLTEAGFVAKEGAQGMTVYGDAYKYRTGYLLFNEISNIFLASETTHSATLINQVMEALSERRVSKRVGNMDVQYDTYMSIWGGIQPIRFDFSKGIGRRFAYITRRWRLNEIELLKLDRLEQKLNGGSYTDINMEEVQKLRLEIKDIQNKGAIERVKWDRDFFKQINDMARTHTEAQMIERIIIGAAYVNQIPGETVLDIKRSNFNKALLENIIDNYSMISEGGDYSLLISSMGNDLWDYDALWQVFRGFSYQLHQFNQLLNSATSAGVIRKKWDPSRGDTYHVNLSLRNGGRKNGGK